MSIHKRLKRGFFTLSSGIFFSRILGYIRDLLIAMWISDRGRDIFFLAFLLPNLSRRILGEGALSSSFVPILSRVVKQKGQEEGDRFASVLLNYLVITLFLVVVLGVVFAPYIVSFFAPGFSASEKVIAVGILRVMFPFALFICLASFFSSYLTTRRNFISTSLSFLLFNLSLIAFLWMRNKFPSPLLALSWGVVMGGVLQFLIHLPFLIKKGFTYHFQFSHPVITDFARFLLPASFGASIFYVNIAVDRILASFLPAGAISALYYSNRLLQFPLALTGIAMSMVSLPLFSRIGKEEVSSQLTQALKWLLFLTLPATLFLSLLGKPIISILFEHGKFTSLSTLGTYSALLFYSLGLFFFAGSRVLNTVFYSFHHPWLPVKIGVWSILTNIVFDLILIRPLQQGGLALATSLSSLVGFILLLYHLPRRVKVKVSMEKKWMIKFFLIYLVLIMVSLSLYILMGKLSGIIEIGKLALIIGGGVGLYIWLAHKFEVMEVWSGKKK